jgi:hypothetical protein
MLDHIIEPIAVGGRRLWLPGIGHLAGYMFRWKLRQQLVPSVNECARTERVEYICGLFVKITFRHLGLSVPFTAQKATDISSIFTSQGVGVVFGVALEK